MRRRFVAGNWKMFKTIAEATAFAKEFLPKVASNSACDIALGAPFTALSALAQACKGSNVAVSAQDCYWEENGAFTGEVAVPMIKDAGCAYVIIGHSERRQFFGETNETVNKKTKAALKGGLKPIVCVGETLQEREGGVTEKVLDDHVRNGLAGLSAADMESVTIAYEPVWAIGTGKTATPAQAQEAHAFIRKVMAQMWNAETAAKVRIQYGGSVKPENAKELMGQADIDGALVGGASLKPDSFAAICNA